MLEEANEGGKKRESTATSVGLRGVGAEGRGVEDGGRGDARSEAREDKGVNVRVRAPDDVVALHVEADGRARLGVNVEVVDAGEVGGRGREHARLEVVGGSTVDLLSAHVLPRAEVGQDGGERVGLVAAGASVAGLGRDETRGGT